MTDDALPTPAVWRRVDTYLAETLVGHDAALEAAVHEQDAAGLPAIEVAPLNGKLLHLLARAIGAAGAGDRHARRLLHDLAGTRGR